ncbi:MAG: DUF4139 domain-containing protein [Proteobacteria bacterium]|jgi:hypothetical protein|nr:DUF4139 domain-containing protein [Pseudomonadota bacterium]
MRATKIGTTSLIVLAYSIAFAGPAGGAPKAKTLETSRVTIYDCGLAQIERQAQIDGAARLELGVSLSNLDDLLASLVVATDGTVQVRSASYPRVLNLAQAAAASGLGMALSEGGDGVALPAEIADLTAKLAGTRVEIARRDGGRLSGAVLAVAAGAPRAAVAGADGAAQPVPRDDVAIVTDDGAIAFVPLEEIASMRPSSALEASALGDLASRLGRASGTSPSPVVLEVAPASRGRLAVSYIQEAPLWRMSYRVVVRKGKLSVESWAIVHNDTSEDWRDVELTLVSGLPRSYVASIASPRYASRELHTDEVGEMTPQIGVRTADALLYGFSAYQLEGAGGIGMSGIGYGGGGTGSGVGYGSAAGRIGVGASAPAESESSLIEVGEPAAAVEAEARVEGEIATYRALNQVTIPAGTSAAVPVLRRELPGEVFTLLEDGRAPATCSRVENGTGLVLQAGMASFYVDGRFRGEAALERTQPEEIGVWCFGEDPDISFSVSSQEEMAPELLEWRGGQLYAHGKKRTELEFSVDNAAGQARLVALDVRHLRNGRITTPGRIVEGDATGRSFFLVEAPARTEELHAVSIEEGVRQPVPLEIARLAELEGAEAIPDAQRRAVADARAFLVKERQLEVEAARLEVEAQAADKRAAELKATLESVPPIKGKLREVDRILAEIGAVQKKATELRAQASAAVKRAVKARESAENRLAAIPTVKK